jgi:sialate O-acetylesterase
VKHLLLILVFASAVRADISLSPVFTDNMVLQREKPLPIWGTADAGEKIAVAFAGQTQNTTANSAGTWKIILDRWNSHANPGTRGANENQTLEWLLGYERGQSSPTSN